MIDVTSLATAVTASGCLVGDWSFATSSAHDWSDRGKLELHISAVDSILLQFRRSRERVVASSRPLLTPRKLREETDLWGNIARCASYAVRRRIPKAILTLYFFSLTKGFIYQARGSR